MISNSVDPLHATKEILTLCLPKPFHSCLATEPRPDGSQALLIISGLNECHATS